MLGSLGVDAAKRKKEDEVSEEEELKMYDRKVYRACGEMVVATGKELRRLEVPFFCLGEGLVVVEKGGKRKGTISEEEVGVLRGRMLALLEDLCGEE